MTILSTTHKFVFIHLHKCGGSSVEAAYQPHARWCDLVIGSTGEGESLQNIYKALHGLEKHSTAAQLKAIAPEAMERFKVITTVRNPYKIYESYYRWYHRIVHNYAEKRQLGVDAVKAQIVDKSIHMPFARWNVAQPYANSESFADFVLRMVGQKNVRTLTAALSVDGEIAVDEVYKLEEPDRLWEGLAGLVPGLEPSHRNKGAEIATEWNDAAREAVWKKHAKDFEMFGYPA